MKILALIPARSGSKSIKDKNIQSLNGKPMLAYSIQHAIESTLVDRVILDTDDEYYAKIGRSFGAETPYLRPKDIAGDFSTDIEVFNHALKWLQENEQEVPDILVHLRPTYPIRAIEDIDNMIQLLLDNPSADAVRSVSPSPETPYKMWFMNDGILSPVIDQNEINEPYNQPRQSLPTTYLQNACIDVMWSKTILEKKSMTGDVILGYKQDENYDIDYQHQLDRVVEIIQNNNLPINASDKRTYCFDIDGCIAKLSPNNDYKLAKPNPTVITKVNQLYNEGHKIILFTARGTMTGIDWSEVTSKQMREWGVNYHELKFGKPAADVYVDDRAANIINFI